MNPTRRNPPVVILYPLQGHINTESVHLVTKLGAVTSPSPSSTLGLSTTTPPSPSETPSTTTTATKTAMATPGFRRRAHNTTPTIPCCGREAFGIGGKRVKPKDIDICSLFSPTPSLSAMVVNRYWLRSNAPSFNLSRMGCSVGLISVDLARDLLQAHRDTYALVVSTKIITPNYYTGMERAMSTNCSMKCLRCIFRRHLTCI